MKTGRLTASSLRIILSVSIVLMIGLSAVGFYFAQNWLRALAVDVSHTVADSSSTGDNIQSLQKLQEELTAKQSVTTKLALLSSNAQDWQTQVVRDLDAYSKMSGIEISGYSGFTLGSTAPATVATTPAVTTPAAAVASSNPTATITLKSPLSYTNLLKFMKLIENNIPKMQVANINLTRTAGGGDTITADTLTVEVYTQ
jgi:ribosomal protein L30E